MLTRSGLGETVSGTAAARPAGCQETGVIAPGPNVIATNDDAIRFYERLDLHCFVVVYVGNVPADPGRA